jgi:HD-like signal output (HDOD) protein
MMTANLITRDEVLQRSDSLPVLPAVINKLITTLNDPYRNTQVLVEHITHEALIAARILLLINNATHARHRHIADVYDLNAAISLIGPRHVREMVLADSYAAFVKKIASDQMAQPFLQHSLSVAICCEELAIHINTPSIWVETAWIAGLLHEIGTLWLYRFRNQEFHLLALRAAEDMLTQEAAERAILHADHATIGAWLAEYWGLPAAICSAIKFHHTPEGAHHKALVPLVHVAEVLSSALNLPQHKSNRVCYISGDACKKINLSWGNDSQQLFDRIAAHTRRSITLYLQTPMQVSPNITRIL